MAKTSSDYVCVDALKEPDWIVFSDKHFPFVMAALKDPSKLEDKNFWHDCSIPDKETLFFYDGIINEKFVKYKYEKLVTKKPSKNWIIPYLGNAYTIY